MNKYKLSGLIFFLATLGSGAILAIRSRAPIDCVFIILMYFSASLYGEFIERGRQIENKP